MNGNVTFDGATTNTLLTAGVLNVKGNFSQTAASFTGSFAASGTHKVVLFSIPQKSRKSATN